MRDIFKLVMLMVAAVNTVVALFYGVQAEYEPATYFLLLALSLMWLSQQDDLA